jgi:hypothetical protein
MAQATNTYDSYDSARNREEFANAIHMITPEETPLISLLGREKVESRHPEWSTDTLARRLVRTSSSKVTNTPIRRSPRPRASATTPKSRACVHHLAHAGKTLKAGPKSELGRERRKKGVELRKDMEASLLSNKASVAGAAGTARVGRLAAWLTSNDSRGSGGSDGGFNTSTSIVDAATNGTQRAFTKAILDAVILASYNSGGNPTVFMCSPYVKTVFSTMMQRPTPRRSTLRSRAPSRQRSTAARIPIAPTSA